MHRDGDARHEETRRARRRSTKPSEEPRRSNPRRKVTCRGGHGALSHSLSLSLSAGLCAIARGLSSAAGSRSGSGVGTGAADRASIVLPRGRGGTTAALFVRACASVTQSIDSLVACREGGGGRGGRGRAAGKEDGGDWENGGAGGGGGGSGSGGGGGGQKGDGGQEEEEEGEEGAGAAEFPLKTQTRPRMHARCNPMVCIRYARRYPPRGKRLLHRAINV